MSKTTGNKSSRQKSSAENESRRNASGVSSDGKSGSAESNGSRTGASHTMRKMMSGSANGKHGRNERSSASSNGKTKSSSSAGKSKSASAKGGKTLEDLLIDGLMDIYSAETQLIEALPEMSKAAYDEDLADAFNHHLEETKRQVERLEKVFSRLGMSTDSGKTCEAMEGLISEGQHIISEYDESPVRDAALIIAAQKVEHYEIASYGSLCELCDVLGYHRIGDILGRSLDEEEETDEKLTDIARHVNDEACEVSEHKGAYEFSGN